MQRFTSRYRDLRSYRAMRICYNEHIICPRTKGHNIPLYGVGTGDNSIGRDKAETPYNIEAVLSMEGYRDLDLLYGVQGTP
jgi:hypothetical protein